MKIAAIGARLFLGLVFIIFGLNDWVEIISFGVPHPFIQIMSDAGLFYVVKALEVLGGVMLLANFFVPVALVILGPIATNIVLYGIFVDRSFLALDVIIFGLTAFLVGAYWSYFKGIFTKRAEPLHH
jgi:uncharacterized membrane protein YphA (DoxX/SURF4 family)